MGEMTVEKRMVGVSVDMLLKNDPNRKLIEVVKTDDTGEGFYTVCYDNEALFTIVETTMYIGCNALTCDVVFGDKNKIFELLKKYLGVKPMGWDDMPDEKKTFKTYNYPVKVRITATDDRIVIERIKDGGKDENSK